MIQVNNKLLILGGYQREIGGSNKIYSCNINNKWNWNLSKLQLPQKMKFDQHCKCVVIYGCVIVIFNFKDNYIWFLDAYNLDIIDNTHWIQIKIDLKLNQSTLCILAKNNFVHFLYPFRSDESNRYHKSISILKLLPNNIKNKYGPKLVFGYLSTTFKHINLSNNFPDDIKKVIVMFYIGIWNDY